ncbi:hypothetical protein N0V82_006408 [Gnomoniopsis sp. IMI 355080]|nr:hypothetical protein N0V82_006408 [Gnomoniopsis sp. IMI 355080]
MKASIGLILLFAIWLARGLLACAADGNKSSMSNMGYSMNKSTSSSYQIICRPVNITHLYKETVTSMGTITTASSSEWLKQTVTAIKIASPCQLQQDAQLDLTAQVPSSHFNTTQTSSSASSLDGKLTYKSLEISHTSSKTKSPFPVFPSDDVCSHFVLVATDTAPSEQGSSAKGLLTRNAQEIRSGNTSVPSEFQALSMPVLNPDPTVSNPQAASMTSSSVTPTAQAVTPAPATHNALVIGVVLGVPCGLLLAVLVAAACCSSRVRQRLWFWRRAKNQAPAMEGRLRCESAATTLTAGSAGISNTSSDTIIEAYGVRPGQMSANAGGRGPVPLGGTRTYESYEMDSFRAGYSAGGFLSAV